MFLKFASGICRVCLGPEVAISLFEGSGNDEIFTYTTGIEISENDGLPNFLCQNCFDSLNAANRFKEQSIASDSQLHSFVESVNTKFISEIGNFQQNTTDDREKALCISQVEIKESDGLESLENARTTLKIEVIDADESEQAKENSDEEIIAAEQIEANLLVETIHVQPQETISSEFIETEENSENEYIANALHDDGSTTCTKCNKTFSIRANLLRHMLTHAEVKPFACSVCHSRFTQKGSLKQHMLRHTGERPFKCDMCEKAFSRKRLLGMHVRTHTGEKPYYCEKCGLSFTVKEGLRRHNLRKHLGVHEPIYTCEICQKKLHSKYTYNNHCNMHNRNPQAQYICGYCNKTFVSKASLQAHAKSHDSEEPCVYIDEQVNEEIIADESNQDWVVVE